MHPRIPFLLALRASLWRFQMPLKGFNFVKPLVTFGIIYATDPLLQNMTTIVCLRCLTFDIFADYKPLQTVLNDMGQFYEISIVYHTLYLWNEDGDPQFFFFFFFCISGTGNSLSTGSKNIKKFYRQENFRLNVLKRGCPPFFSLILIINNCVIIFFLGKYRRILMSVNLFEKSWKRQLSVLVCTDRSPWAPGTEKILKMELFKNDDVTIITW